MAACQRFPLGIAIITLLLITSLWFSRDNIQGSPGTSWAAPKSWKGPRKSWYEIALSHGTDKVTTHNYERMYEHRLAPMRDQKIKFLEIGLGCDMNYGPGKSYATWLEYFPYVDLYYIEYDAACAKLWANKTDRATVFAGDQADIPFLNYVIAETGGEFDVIIDDGGHTMKQQQVSFAHLWPVIKPGGIYFIEDLQTSYMGQYGGGPAKTPGTMMDDLKNILDDMNEFSGVGPSNPRSEEIESFEFTREVVALQKFGPHGKNYHGPDQP